MPWRENVLPLKKELFFIERDEEKRQAFDAEIADLPPDTDIVYIDESGIKKHMSREYGRSPVGERVYLASHGRKYSCSALKQSQEMVNFRNGLFDRHKGNGAQLSQ
jgi:hypothetical protein